MEMEGSEIDFDKFKKVFPGVPIKRLIEQRYDIGTDDSCIHFMDKETKRVYSWNYLEGDWEYQEKCQDELRTTLFEKETKII